MGKLLDANVKLTEEDKATIQASVISQRNISKACAYADIHYYSFMKAIEEYGTVTTMQRKKLLEFCNRVKAIA